MADEDVLQGIIKRMANMQIARHIGRRVDDGLGLRVWPLRPKSIRALPMRIPFGFDARRVKIFVDSHARGS